MQASVDCKFMEHCSCRLHVRCEVQAHCAGEAVLDVARPRLLRSAVTHVHLHRGNIGQSEHGVHAVSMHDAALTDARDEVATDGSRIGCGSDLRRG